VKVDAVPTARSVPSPLQAGIDLSFIVGHSHARVQFNDEHIRGHQALAGRSATHSQIYSAH